MVGMGLGSREGVMCVAAGRLGRPGSDGCGEAEGTSKIERVELTRTPGNRLATRARASAIPLTSTPRMRCGHCLWRRWRHCVCLVVRSIWSRTRTSDQRNDGLCDASRCADLRLDPWIGPRDSLPERYHGLPP